MKIEIKNIKHYEAMSEETNCYSATLHVDGKKIGEVSNRGHGGPDDFHGDQAAYDKANAWIKANLPPLESSYGGDPLDMDIELYCGELLSDWLISRDLKKNLRGRVLFIQPGKEGVFEMRWKGTRKVDERHIKAAQDKHPEAIILNALPFEEALVHFKKHG